MSPVSRYAFVNSRIHGMMAKAYFGDRLKTLLRYKSILDAAKALYPKAQDAPSPGLVETSALEARVHQDSVDCLIGIMGRLESPEALLIHLLRAYEIQNIKNWLRARAQGSQAGRYWQLGRFATLEFSGAAPDFGSGEYAWLKARLDESEIFPLELELDRRYYARLEDLADALRGTDRRAVHPLVTLETFLGGLVWMLRLRSYFKKLPEELESLGIPQRDAAYREALQRAVHLPLDDLGAWRNWRYFWLLRSQDNPDFRTLDPGQVETTARAHLFRKYRLGFNRNLFTLGPLFCFFRLKESEASLVQSVLEGIHMGLSEEDLLPLMGQ